MSYLRHIQRLNPPITEPLLAWSIDQHVVGWVRPDLAEQLLRMGTGFALESRRLTFAPEQGDFEGRSAALARTIALLRRAKRDVHYLAEPYPVTPGGREQALCVIDRGAVGFFGVRSFGQHMNGFVRDHDGIRMWIGRRARDRRVSPGGLDQLVAGGLPHGIEPMENLKKEAMEEAGIVPELVERALPVSALSYNRLTAQGFRPDILYCYDLELPSDWQPRNFDGEVEEFLLLPIDEVMRLVRETDQFKSNCNLVILDFLIRHGLLEPGHAEYLDITGGLHPVSGVPASPAVASEGK